MGIYEIEYNPETRPVVRFGKTLVMQFLYPLAGSPQFCPRSMRSVLFGESVKAYDRVFAFAKDNPLFWVNPNPPEGHLFTGTDYDMPKKEQRELTFKRILCLRDAGFFDGWMTDMTPNGMRESLAFSEAFGMLDHSLTIKIGVHFRLWYEQKIPVVGWFFVRFC